MEQSVPKRRHIKFRRRGITQKKAYDIQNKAKVCSDVRHPPCVSYNRKELRVEYAQSNTTIITSIINIIGINNYMFRHYVWAIIRL